MRDYCSSTVFSTAYLSTALISPADTTSKRADYSHLLRLLERRTMTITALIALLLKILSNPALLAAFITFLQKTLHP
jgi:hypothetical protein